MLKKIDWITKATIVFTAALMVVFWGIFAESFIILMAGVCLTGAATLIPDRDGENV